MNTKFDELVRGLDAETLEELRRAVAGESGGRKRGAGIAIEQIRAGMSAQQKEQAMKDIARVLRGEEADA